MVSNTWPTFLKMWDQMKNYTVGEFHGLSMTQAKKEPTNFALCFTTSFIDQGIFITYDTLRDCPSSEQRTPMYKYTHAYTTNESWIFCVITSTITTAAATYTAFFFLCLSSCLAAGCKLLPQ